MTPNQYVLLFSFSDQAPRSQKLDCISLHSHQGLKFKEPAIPIIRELLKRPELHANSIVFIAIPAFVRAREMALKTAHSNDPSLLSTWTVISMSLFG